MTMIKKLPMVFMLLTSIRLYAGGLFVYEVGSPDMGTASAGWAARAQDAATVFTNPAGMSRFCNPQLTAGIEPIYINARFSPNSKTTVRGKNGNASTWIPAGGFFYSRPLTDKISVGIASVGYLGSALDWGTKWVGRYHARKNLLQGYSLVLAGSYQLTPSLSVGAGLNTMYGVMRQFSSINNGIDRLPDGKLSFKDRHYGFGGIAGILYEPSCGTRLGLTYLSSVHLHFSNRPKAHQVGPTLRLIFDRLRLDSTKLKVTIKTPQMVMASFYKAMNGCLAILGNVGWQEWSNFGRVDIALRDVNTNSLKIKTKYKDTWHAALGLQYQILDPLRLSCGIAYDSSFVSNKNRPVTLPVGEQWRFGTGALFQWRQNVHLYANYEFLWSGNLKVNQSKGVLLGRISGHYRQFYTHFFNMGINTCF